MRPNDKPLDLRHFLEALEADEPASMLRIPEPVGIDFDVTAEEIDRHYEVQHPGESWHDSVFDRREVGDHALQKWKSVEDPPAWAAQLFDAWHDDQEIAATMQALGYHPEGFADPELDELDNIFRPPVD